MPQFISIEKGIFRTALVKEFAEVGRLREWIYVAGEQRNENGSDS
jgi:hypothetical protein